VIGMLRPFRDDGSVNIIVESPRGSTAKFKYDTETGAMMLSRQLPMGVVYPYDWGFIPSTRAADGDPLDAMVLWDGASFPGVVLPSRLIGILRVEQTTIAKPAPENNDRVFAIPMKAARFDHVRTIFDLPERVRLELEQFFVSVVAFEGKHLRLSGFDGPAEADRVLRAAVLGEP
jgi:inorganic pyrophosphatase